MIKFFELTNTLGRIFEVNWVRKNILFIKGEKVKERKKEMYKLTVYKMKITYKLPH